MRRRSPGRERSFSASAQAWLTGASPKTGDLGVGGRRDDVVHPLVHAVRVLGLRGDHPGVGPAGRPFLRQDRLDRDARRPSGCSPGTARSCRPPWRRREVVDLVWGACQYSPTNSCWILKQVDRGLELGCVELIRIRDLEVGLVGLQVDGRVGDVDRAVVGGDLALVGRSCRSKTTPQLSGRRSRCRSATSDVLPPRPMRAPRSPCRRPCYGPGLQERRRVLEVRGSDRIDLGRSPPAISQCSMRHPRPRRRRTGRRRRPASAETIASDVTPDLDVDLPAAALLSLGRRDPVEYSICSPPSPDDVAGPYHEVELALAGPHRGR